MTTQRPRRKKIFFGWWVLAGSMGIQVFFGSLMGGFGTLVVPLANEFSWSKTVFAGAAGLRQIESGMLGPFQGWLNDRYNSQTLIRFGLIVWGLGFMGLSQIDSITGFYITFVAAAMGASLGGVQTLNVPIVNWFERRRATALALLTTGFSLGGLLVPAIAWSMETYGWRATLFGAGIAIIAIGLPLSVLIRHRPEPYGWLPDGAEVPVGRPVSPTKAAQVDPRDFSAREALATAAFWQVAFGHASALVVVSSVNLYLVAFLTETLSMSLVEAASYATALNGASIAAQIVGGLIGDRVDKRIISAFCMFGHMGAILLLGYVNTVWAVWLFIALHGGAWGMRGPLMVAIRADYFGRSSFGTINGIASGVTTLGMFGGPLIVGLTTDLLGGYQTGFSVIALISGLGSILFFMAKRPPKPSRPGGSQPSVGLQEAGQSC